MDQTVTTLVAWGKALANPARVQILRILCRNQTCLCGEIVEGLTLAQSTVSQHLKVLREAGLIKAESDGTRSCYCLDREQIKRVRAEVNQLFDQLEGAPDCCS